MPDVVKHAWTHRPRAEGGTDPIEMPSATTWCLASEDLVSIEPVSDIYRTGFTYLTHSTNATGDYTLSTPGDGDRSDWLEIHAAGYYHMYCGVVLEAANTWGAFDTTLEVVWQKAGVETMLNQWMNWSLMFNNADFNRAKEQFAAEDDHRGMWEFLSFYWNPGANDVVATDEVWIEDEDPLRLGLRVRCSTGASVTLDMTSQIHLHKIADAGFVFESNFT